MNRTKDWPMPPHPGAGDEDCRTPDDCANLLVHRPLIPPPDVYEYFRRHGRWPAPGEA